MIQITPAHRHRGLGAVRGQRVEAPPLAAGQHQREHLGHRSGSLVGLVEVGFIHGSAPVGSRRVDADKHQGRHFGRLYRRDS